MPTLYTKLSDSAFWLRLCRAGLYALSHSASAQQPKKVPRIGYLSPGTSSNVAARTEAFRQGLHDLGYVDGKNIVMEWRHADGKLDHLPAFAAELVRLKVEVIVTGGSASTRAAPGNNLYHSHCHDAGP
jgi:putative ABC transport system substrate-binding protein